MYRIFGKVKKKSVGRKYSPSSRTSRSPISLFVPSRTHLKKPSDKIEKEAPRGIVYENKCRDCDCVYVGQTSRALKTSQCQVLPKRTPFRGDIFQLILRRYTS